MLVAFLTRGSGARPPENTPVSCFRSGFPLCTPPTGASFNIHHLGLRTMGLFRKKNSQPPVSARLPVPRTLSLPDLHDSPSGELSVPSAWLDPSVKDSYHQPATVGPSFSLNGHGPQGGTGTPKSSFSAIRTGFHRPFRGGPAGAPSVASPSVSSFAAPGSMYGMKRGAGSVRTKGKKLVSTHQSLRKAKERADESGQAPR